MQKISLGQIKEYLDEQEITYHIRGNSDICVEGFSSLSNYKENTMTWIKKGKSEKKQQITLCVVQEGAEIEADVQIISPDSKKLFFSLIEHFWGDNNGSGVSVGAGTIISDNVRRGNNVVIGNNCSICGEITIGNNVVIGDNVVIRNRVSIGNNCNIQSLSVIGEDGFAYSEDDNHVKTMIKHYGGVQIGDNVFIGSHVNIARGTIDDTIISNGVKIAPSTHIGHNNYIAENTTIICSQLYGSVKTGENAYITASVVRNQLSIGDNAVIGMGSVVTKDVGECKVVVGSPAKVIRERQASEKI